MLGGIARLMQGARKGQGGLSGDVAGSYDDRFEPVDSSSLASR